MFSKIKSALLIASLQLSIIVTSSTTIFAADDIFEDKKERFFSSKQEYLATPNYGHLKKATKSFSPNEDYLNAGRKLIEGKQLSPVAIGLFKGRDPFSIGIRWITDSDWSHVGLILSDQDGIRYCFESTGSAGDIFKGILPQVQIHLLDDTLQTYDGSVAVREFTFTGTTQPSTEFTMSYINENLGKYYEGDIGSLLNAINRNNEVSKSKDEEAEKLKNVFCSELVGDYCKKTNLFKPEIDSRPADNFLPRDFSAKEFLPWNDGVTIGKEKILKTKKSSCCIIV